MPNDNFHSSPGNPVEELKTTILWKRLNSLSTSKSQAMCDFVSLIDPYLKDITEYFPLYTRHECHHGYQVLERMAQIIHPDLLDNSKESLTEDEVVCLIVSAYAHDIGMTIFERVQERDEFLHQLNLPSNVENTNSKLTDHLRRNHAERGEKFLRFSDAGRLISQSLTDSIGKIMKSHNLAPDKLKDELSEIEAVGRHATVPLALAIILCCADVLEFSDTRVLDSAYEEACIREDAAAKKSLLEMRKHRAIGENVAIQEGFIFISGTFNDTEALHAMHIALNQIESWLKQYIKLISCCRARFRRDILNIKSPIIKRRLKEPFGIIYHPVAIKIDERQMKKLFTSENLWGSQKVTALKELIQNTIDACRYREYISTNAEDYKPNIEIIFNMETSEITVTDNGCGMDKDDILEFFLRLGKSKTRSRQFETDPRNRGFYPIARFGVGFWSVFTIADKASVKTKLASDENSEGFIFEVTMEPVMRYLKLIKDNNVPEGTSIKLKLKKDIDNAELLDRLNHVITSPPVPISIKDYTGQTLTQFPTNLPVATSEDFFEYFNQEALTKGIEWFSCSLQTDNIEVTSGIAYSIINNEVRCLTPDMEPMTSLIPSGFKDPSVSICGLEVNINYPFFTLPLAITHVGVLKVNIKTPKGLNFSFYRKDLQENPRLIEIKNDLHKCISKGISQFYNHAGVAEKPDKIALLISDTRGSGGDSGISDLYFMYQNYYKNLVPMCIYKWQKVRYKLSLLKKWKFIEEFWLLDKPVIYIPEILHKNNRTRNETYYINWACNITKRDTGYLVFASREASAIIDVANKTLVKHAMYPYPNSSKIQYLEILPEYGYSENKSYLFSIDNAPWAGCVFKIEFEKNKNYLPWMPLGQQRIFLDSEHKITERLVESYNKGNIWEVGHLLSLMQTNNESAYKEIERLTGIKILK
jgi:hypothetical protein